MKPRALGYVAFLSRVLRVTPTPAQRVFCLVAYDGVEPSALDGEDRELARKLFGDVDAIPPEARHVIAAVCGARGGKSYLFCALRLLHLALTVDLATLAPGEQASALIVAPDLRLARQTLRYALGAAKGNREIAKRITGESSDGFTLAREGGRLVAIECLPATRGGSALRGRSLVGAVLDESAFFRDENYAVNDGELFKAVAPRILPGGQTILASTPWAEGQGLLYDLFHANFGAPRTALAAHAPTLLLRDDNPARDVAAPDRGTDRTSTYLYPREFEAMLASRRVPNRWKRIFAIATYLYLRGGELEALEWSAVNLEQHFVSIHRSATEDGEIKVTKTGRNRKTPIESSLLPLLSTMRDTAKGEGLVISAMPPREEWAERLRKYVRWGLEDAGLPVREELFASDATRRQITFHSLRHSGITWRAIRGDDLVKIQRAAGHSDLKMTSRYVEEAEVFDREAFGDVFPLLSTSLAGADRIGQESEYWPGAKSRNAVFSDGYERPQRESNPR